MYRQCSETKTRQMRINVVKILFQNAKMILTPPFYEYCGIFGSLFVNEPRTVIVIWSDK